MKTREPLPNSPMARMLPGHLGAAGAADPRRHVIPIRPIGLRRAQVVGGPPLPPDELGETSTVGDGRGGAPRIARSLAMYWALSPVMTTAFTSPCTWVSAPACSRGLQTSPTSSRICLRISRRAAKPSGSTAGGRVASVSNRMSSPVAITTCCTAAGKIHFRPRQTSQRTPPRIGSTPSTGFLDLSTGCQRIGMVPSPPHVGHSSRYRLRTLVPYMVPF